MRTEAETTLIGNLYIQRERDGTKEEVATVEGAGTSIQIEPEPTSDLAAGSLQATIEALSARIKALES